MCGGVEWAAEVAEVSEEVWKGVEEEWEGCYAVRSGRDFSVRAPSKTGPKRLHFVMPGAPPPPRPPPQTAPGPLGGASRILPYFPRITRITRPITHHFFTYYSYHS